MRRLTLLAALGVALFVACGSDPSPTPSQPLPVTTAATTATSGGGQGGDGGAVPAGAGGIGGDGGTGGIGGAGATTSTTSSTTSSTTGGMGCTGGSGGGGGGAAGPPDAVIAVQGQPGRLLLQGVIVTPDQVLTGELLIDGTTIACVAASCAAHPAAQGASIVVTNGILFPGLIDTHNHVLFDIFDETDWTPLQAYGDHDDWPNEARYKAMVDAKQYLNGEGSPLDLGCEMLKFGELKALVAGTTSVAGSANPANKACYGSLARTIDQGPNDLPVDKVQAATLFPSAASADGVCTNFGDGDTTAYLIHIAEGVNQTALNEFAALNTVTTIDGCLYSPMTTIIHGTALGDAELSTMAQAGMKLTWSPASNVALYGLGTDLTKTTDVPLALSKGINVALAPDWSMGGSQNLLDELRFADKVDDALWGDVLTPKMLTEMVTINAARNLHLEAVLGSLEVGKRADVMVITGDLASPYDALLAATPSDVRLVIVDGVPLYGDDELAPLGPAMPGCEPLDVCCAGKFVCVAEAGATEKIGQTVGEITGALQTALEEYDAMNLTQWDFAPLTPLVRCQ